MGSFIYMLQNKDTMIDETKRLELEQRLETVFNEAGMMGLSQMTLYDHKIVVMHPVRIENGYTTFYYNYLKMMFGKMPGIQRMMVFILTSWEEESLVVR